MPLARAHQLRTRTRPPAAQTLIKIITGEHKASSGTVWRHPNLRMAYVAQHAFHHLEEHLDTTPLKYMFKRFGLGEDKEDAHKVIFGCFACLFVFCVLGRRGDGTGCDDAAAAQQQRVRGCGGAAAGLPRGPRALQ